MNTTTARPESPFVQLPLPCFVPRHGGRHAHPTQPLRQSSVQCNGVHFLRLEGRFADVCAALDRLCALEK